VALALVLPLAVLLVNVGALIFDWWRDENEAIRCARR